MKSKSKAQTNSDFWWRNSSHFDLDDGCAVPKAKVQAEFDFFWKPRDFIVWTYEIVRRLPNIKDIQFELSLADLQALKCLPPYPSLTPTQYRWLEDVIKGTSPILHIRSSHPAHRDGYTAPLPPLSFDRERISKKAILEFVGRWIDSEDRRLNLPQPEPQKGKSRNRDQTHKSRSWKMVEIAARDKEDSTALSRQEQKARSAAKRHGLHYYRQVITAYELAQTNFPMAFPPIPPSPESVGKGSSLAELNAALKAVIAKKDARLQDDQIAGIAAAQKYSDNPILEERTYIEKVHHATLSALETDAEKQAYNAGVDAAAAMQDADMMDDEMPPGMADPMAGGGADGGEISAEDIRTVLQQLIQNGETDEKTALDIMQAIQGGGAGGPHRGGMADPGRAPEVAPQPGGDGSGGAPGKKKPKARPDGGKEALANTIAGVIKQSSMLADKLVAELLAEPAQTPAAKK